MINRLNRLHLLNRRTATLDRHPKRLHLLNRHPKRLNRRPNLLNRRTNTNNRHPGEGRDKAFRTSDENPTLHSSIAPAFAGVTALSVLPLASFAP